MSLCGGSLSLEFYVYAEYGFTAWFKDDDDDNAVWKHGIMRIEESPINGKKCLSAAVLKHLLYCISINSFIEGDKVKSSLSSILLFVKFKFLLM